MVMVSQQVSSSRRKSVQGEPRSVPRNHQGVVSMPLPTEQTTERAPPKRRSSFSALKKTVGRRIRRGTKKSNYNKKGDDLGSDRGSDHTCSSSSSRISGRQSPPTAGGYDRSSGRRSSLPSLPPGGGPSSNWFGDVEDSCEYNNGVMSRDMKRQSLIKHRQQQQQRSSMISRGREAAMEGMYGYNGAAAEEDFYGYNNGAAAEEDIYGYNNVAAPTPMTHAAKKRKSLTQSVKRAQQRRQTFGSARDLMASMGSSGRDLMGSSGRDLSSPSQHGPGGNARDRDFDVDDDDLEDSILDSIFSAVEKIYDNHR